MSTYEDLFSINRVGLEHFFVSLYYETWLFGSWWVECEKYRSRLSSSFFRWISNEKLNATLRMVIHDGATFHWKYSVCFSSNTLMSSSGYTRYFYGNMEFPNNGTDKNLAHNCELDSFFRFYCSIITDRSENYLARLPAFNQCLSNTNNR